MAAGAPREHSAAGRAGAGTGRRGRRAWAAALPLPLPLRFRPRPHRRHRPRGPPRRRLRRPRRARGPSPPCRPRLDPRPRPRWSPRQVPAWLAWTSFWWLFVDCQCMIARLRGAPLTQRQQQRLLEILPGALTWFVLAVPVVTAFLIRLNTPADLWILGVGAVLLDFYWLLRTVWTVVCVRRSLAELRRTEAVDWWQRCLELEEALAPDAPRPTDIVHCALIPTYTERYEVLRGTVAALAAQNYPRDHRVCAIITRVTDKGGWDNVARLRDEFGDQFRAFIHIK